MFELAIFREHIAIVFPPASRSTRYRTVDRACRTVNLSVIHNKQVIHRITLAILVYAVQRPPINHIVAITVKDGFALVNLLANPSEGTVSLFRVIHPDELPGKIINRGINAITRDDVAGAIVFR